MNYFRVIYINYNFDIIAIPSTATRAYFDDHKKFKFYKVTEKPNNITN